MATDPLHGLVHDFLARQGLEKTLKTFRKEVRQAQLALEQSAQNTGATLEAIVEINEKIQHMSDTSSDSSDSSDDDEDNKPAAKLITARKDTNGPPKSSSSSSSSSDSSDDEDQVAPAKPATTVTVPNGESSSDSSGTSSASSDDEDAIGPAVAQVALKDKSSTKAPAGSSSDDSSSSDSSDDDENDQAIPAAPAAAPVAPPKAPLNSKSAGSRDSSSSSSSSSSDDDSDDDLGSSKPSQSLPISKSEAVDSSSDSSSDSDSSDDEDKAGNIGHKRKREDSNRPDLAKNVKVAKMADSSSDSSSDSSDEEPPSTAVVSSPSAKAALPDSSSEDSSSDSSDSDSSDSDSSDDEDTSGLPNGQREVDKTKTIAEIAAEKGMAIPLHQKELWQAKKGQGTPKRFSRIDVEKEISRLNPHLMNNSYQAAFGENGYGAKASAKFVAVRGKDFRHEKTKAKRGTFRGVGQITGASNSYKYPSSSSEED